MASDHRLSFGASGADATGVCGTTNVDLVRSIGADRVIDHAQDDFTRDGKEYGASRHECGSIEGSRAVVPSSGRRCSIGSSEVPRPGRGTWHFARTYRTPPSGRGNYGPGSLNRPTFMPGGPENLCQPAVPGGLFLDPGDSC